jgi:hypothetical protein
MAEYEAYEVATLYVQERTKLDQSVINASIISAVRGHYDNFHMIQKTRGSRLWISPLMTIMWFFNAQALADRSLFLDSLEGTSTFGEAMQAFVIARQQVKRRAEKKVGLQ